MFHRFACKWCKILTKNWQWSAIEKSVRSFTVQHGLSLGNHSSSFWWNHDDLCTPAHSAKIMGLAALCVLCQGGRPTNSIADISCSCTTALFLSNTIGRCFETEYYIIVLAIWFMLLEISAGWQTIIKFNYFMFWNWLRKSKQVALQDDTYGYIQQKIKKPLIYSMKVLISHKKVQTPLFNSVLVYDRIP